MIDIGADLQRAFDEGYEKGKADRPQGEWININTKLFRAQCSACKTWSDVVGNYCPWCGARMKGADDE